LSWIDIAILVITIVGAIFAVALAGLFYQDLAEDVRVAVDNVETARIIAFAMIFGATVLASQLTALFLKQAATLLLLGLFDSLGGAVIGFLKGFIFVEIALIIGITFESLGFRGAIENSALAPIYLDFLPFLKWILPEQFKEAISGF
jgi:uncharacterized membrane protein required for colicin V production